MGLSGDSQSPRAAAMCLTELLFVHYYGSSVRVHSEKISTWHKCPNVNIILRKTRTEVLKLLF